MADNEIKAGDLIGFSGSSWGSVTICLGTYGIPWWSLSHVGVVGDVFVGDLNYPSSLRGVRDECSAPGTAAKHLLFESTIGSERSCVIRGGLRRGTQAHWPHWSVGTYKGKVWHYPLYRHLRPLESVLFTKYLIDNLGKDYDLIGAMRSGGVGLSWIETMFREEDLSSLFCSEYVAAAYSHVKLLDSRSASRWNPARLVRRLRRKGILLKPRRLK